MVETIHLQLLLAAFAAWVTRRRAGVIEYLIDESRILKEQLQASDKRIRFTDNQRRRLAAKAGTFGRKTLNGKRPMNRTPLPARMGSDPRLLLSPATESV